MMNKMKYNLRKRRALMFSSMKRELQSLPFVVRNTFLDLAPWKMILFHYKLYFDLSHLLQNAMAIYTILNKSWLFLKQIKPCNSYPISGSIICTIYTQRLQDDCIVVPIKSISKFPDPAMKFYSVYSRVTVETAAVLVVRFTNSRVQTLSLNVVWSPQTVSMVYYIGQVRGHLWPKCQHHPYPLIYT